MTISHNLDRIVASTITFIILLIVAIFSHTRIIGSLLTASTVFLSVCILLRAKPPFLTGASLGLSSTHIVHFDEVLSTPDINSSGFVVMAYFMAIGCGLAGAIIAALLLRLPHFSGAGSPTCLLSGFVGVNVGFWGMLLLQCSTVMWCGPLRLHL